MAGFTIGGLGGLAEAVLGDIQNGFQAGFVLELFDTRLAQAINTFVFVINPTRYELSEPFQAELTPAEDNTVVTEENGIIVRDIVLEGTFGLNKRRAKGFQGAQAHGNSVSGTVHFEYLRSLLRTYSNMKKDPKTSPYTELIFHALKEDEHFKVIPVDFRGPRDSKRNRIHRLYTLRMTAVDGPEYNPSRIKLAKKESGGILDALGDVSKALNDARAEFAEATANLALIERATFGNINALMIQTAGLIISIGNFVRGIKSTLIESPVELQAQIAASWETIADELEEIAGRDPDRNEDVRDAAVGVRAMALSLDRVTQYPEYFQTSSSSLGSDITPQYLGENRLTSSDLENGVAGASIGTRTKLTGGTARDAGINLGPMQSFQTWIVQRSDSIQSIANKTGATPEAIILVNDLIYPYISEGGGPGIAKPGDKLYIPQPRSGAIEEGALTAPAQNNYFTVEDALFGIDMALDLTRLDEDNVLELKVDKAHGSDDAELIRGVQNLIHGLTVTLNTDLGSTVHLPDVGLRPSVGTKGTLQHLLLASINIRDAITDDDRISGIEEIATILDKDVLSHSIRPRLIDGRDVGIAVPFGRASGVGSTTVR